MSDNLWCTRPVCVICIFTVSVLSIVLALFPGITLSTVPDKIAGDTVILEGTVKDCDIYTGYAGRELMTELKSVYLTDSEGMGREALTGQGQYIRAYLPEDTDINIGQRIRVQGRVSPPKEATNPGQFDMLKYYEARGILFNLYDAGLLAKGREYSHIKQALHEAATYGERVLDEYLPKEDAGIMKAMLFADKTDISDDVRTLFKRNGIAHILAISGLHISFLAMLAYRLLGRLRMPVWLRALLSGMLIILYGLMIGFSASALRAICMFSVFLTAKAVKRSYDMLTAMSVALILVALTHPSMLKDTGLQLSYAAVLGVGYFYERFRKNIISIRPVIASAAVSLAIFLTTLPIVLLTYYEAAYYSIFLNLIIIPLMSVLLIAAIMLVITGGIAIASGMALLNMAAMIPTWFIEIILRLYKWLCEISIRFLPGRSNIGAPEIVQVVIFYALLLIAVNIKGKRRAYISGLCILMAMCVISVRPSKGLDIWMLDIGQGDCMVIRYSDSLVSPPSYYVIDCGSSSDRDVGENRLIPMLKYYGADKIDAVFITHPDADHVNGIRELSAEAKEENLDICRIYVFEGFEGAEGLAGIDGELITDAHSGMKLKDKELVFTVLYPESGHTTENANDASLVMDVTCGDFHMLTTGDVEEGGERSIVSGYTEPVYDYDVLKVAHHGSNSSSTEAMLDWADPHIAFISCGRNNSYGHPHRETLDKLGDIGADIYRTDESGAIYLHTDGKRIHLRTHLH